MILMIITLLNKVMRTEKQKCKQREHDRKRDKTEKRKAQKRKNGIALRKRFPDYDWSKKIKRKFGITPEEYNALLEQQNFRCAICKRPEPNGRSNKKWHIDHCHETGIIRGLLCHSCNTSLGHFKDSVCLLEKAIDYLSDDIVIDWNETKQTVKGKYNHAVQY